MKRIIILVAATVLSASQYISAQTTKTDANVVGHVVSEGEHIPFATVAVLGTTIGTATNESGHYRLVNLPVGKHTIIVSMVGYETKRRNVVVQNNQTLEATFELEIDMLNLDEVVVSADRGQQKRTEAPVIVNTISPELFNTSQSVTLGEGLNYSPGLRLENNCQNCGFTQIRMNGMDGAHSQILINSRPIFSGLAGVYGLELLPTTMIERVEVVRGGGSALFGSNAIAGTVNIILKDPVINTYELGANYSLIGTGVEEASKAAPDYSIHANASLVSDDHKTGVSLYGFARNRAVFDANADGFSEIAPLSNLTFGSRFSHKFGSRDKLAMDFFAIKEQRDGGNKFDYPHHERDISESVTHNMYVAGVSYDKYFRDYDVLSVYASG
jgi:outer membrane receptor for ferrienterochelin and colicins